MTHQHKADLNKVAHHAHKLARFGMMIFHRGASAYHNAQDKAGASGFHRWAAKHHQGEFEKHREAFQNIPNHPPKGIHESRSKENRQGSQKRRQGR